MLLAPILILRLPSLEVLRVPECGRARQWDENEAAEGVIGDRRRDVYEEAKDLE